jgi:hypothetical protein
MTRTPRKHPAGAQEDGLRSAVDSVVRSLRRRSSPSRTIRDLAVKLAQCTTAQPCGSGACPRCSIASLKPVKAAVTEALRPALSSIGAVPVMITIAPVSFSVPVGELRDFNLNAAVRRLKRTLHAGSLAWCVGALDFCVNEHATGRYKAHWSVHLHAFSVVKNPKKASRSLSGVLPRSTAIRRPVKVQPWDGKTRAIEYAFKSWFGRRIGTDDVTRCRRNKPDQPVSPWPRSTRLRAAEKHELLTFLDRIGPNGRIVQFGAMVRGRKVILLR